MQKSLLMVSVHWEEILWDTKERQSSVMMDKSKHFTFLIEEWMFFKFLHNSKCNILKVIFLCGMWDGRKDEQMDPQVTYPFRAWFKLFLLFCWELIPKEKFEDKIPITPCPYHLMSSVSHPTWFKGKLLSHKLCMFPMTPDTVFCSKLIINICWL